MYDDLRAVPDHLIAEILDGDLEVSPRPSPRHSHTAWRLSGSLGRPFDQGRDGPGWLFLYVPELHLGPDVVVPDLAAWRRERLAAVPDEPYLSLAPDWVCEILSPSTERIDRLKKTRIYARENVRHLWLINPIARTLEIFGLESGRWVVVGGHGEEDVIHPPPFDTVPLDLSLLWSETASRVAETS